MAITFYSFLNTKERQIIFILFVWFYFRWVSMTAFEYLLKLRSHFSLQGASIFRPSVLESVAMKRMEARHKFGIWIGELLS